MVGPGDFGRLCRDRFLLRVGPHRSLERYLAASRHDLHVVRVRRAVLVGDNRPPDRSCNQHETRQRPWIIENCVTIQEVRAKNEQLAPVASTLLDGGESVTATSLVARASRLLSTRDRKPSIVLDWAAIADALADSHLF